MLYLAVIESYWLLSCSSQYKQEVIFAGKTKELADPSQPFDDNIFGPDLNKHLNQIATANKITAKNLQQNVVEKPTIPALF